MNRILFKHLVFFSFVFVFSLLLIFLLPFVQRWGNTPATVDSKPLKIGFIERKLTELIAPTIRNDPALVDKEALNETMQTIFDRLSLKLPPNPYEFEIFIMDSGAVNAFAAPGGLIVFNTTLLNRCENAEEAAAVMAHEIGHIINKDSVKRLRSELGLSIFFYILSGGSQNMAESLTKMIISNTYSRTQERRADQFCFDLMAKAGIDPIHYANFFDRLLEDGGDFPLEFLSTHPQTEDRIEAAREASRTFDSETIQEYGIDWEQVKESLSSLFR